MIGRKFFVSFLRFAVEGDRRRLSDLTYSKGEYRDIVLKEGWKDARDVGGRLEIS